MKKFLMMLMAFVSVFVMTGCGDAPEDVVAKWGEAVLAGDKAAADELVTDESKKLNGLIILLASDEDGKVEMRKTLDEYQSGEIVVDGDNAEIKVEGKTEVRLKKVDGKWLIDLTPIVLEPIVHTKDDSGEKE